MRKLKVTDYIVEFFVEKGITQAFGYPGGSITNLVDSFYKYKDKISAHTVYHEQAAAFAACGYAQTSESLGVAYAIGGPGATNLITGIGHAYFDSIPLICLTGNVNTYESSKNMKVRQRAFQECEIVSVVEPLTKYCAYVEKAEDIRYHLEKAYHMAMDGRRGPVLLDLPMDVTRAYIDIDNLKSYKPEIFERENKAKEFEEKLRKLLKNAEYPCLILGNGVKRKGLQSFIKKTVENLGIPCMTSMIAFDVMGSHPLFFGFLGASGKRYANFIAAKSDLVISVGSRLDIRQVGVDRAGFAPNANIIRVDIDEGELEYKLHEDECDFCMEAEEALHIMADLRIEKEYSHWIDICNMIRARLAGFDLYTPNIFMRDISRMIPENTVITTDVGQNQVWTAQWFEIKGGQSVLFSGGMGSMGHALPAAIGAHFGSGGKTAVAICGDGGMQMNIQELQFIAREKLPVKIIVFNNNALGMIRHFQETYFEGRYFQTKPEGGFSSPSFSKIAEAYEIRSVEINSIEELEKCRELLSDHESALIEIKLSGNTYEYPKLKFGSPNQDQEPAMDRKLFQELMNLK